MGGHVKSAIIKLIQKTYFYLYSKIYFLQFLYAVFLEIPESRLNDILLYRI